MGIQGIKRVYKDLYDILRTLKVVLHKVLTKARCFSKWRALNINENSMKAGEDFP